MRLPARHCPSSGRKLRPKFRSAGRHRHDSDVGLQSADPIKFRFRPSQLAAKRNGPSGGGAAEAVLLGAMPGAARRGSDPGPASRWAPLNSVLQWPILNLRILPCLVLKVSADADAATCVGQRTTVAGRVATIVASILEAAADSRESS
jgi:hypothetical protein